MTIYRRLLALVALAVFLTACAGGQAAPTSWPGVTLTEDTVYVAYAQQVHAIDIATGQQRWAFPAEAQRDVTLFAEPAVAENLVVAGGYNKAVYALNPENGVPLWTAPFSESLDHIVGQSLVDGERIYVPSADYSLYALDAATGTKVWSFKAKQAIWATPVLADGRLYVASLDHTLYAIDPADGSEIWSRKLGGAIAGTPAIWDGALIVGAFDNKLYAIETEDGSIRWTQPTHGWVWSGPLVEDSTLYYGDLAGYLYAADADTGAKKWEVKPGGALRGTPALADGILYVSARDGYVYFRSAADGTPAAPNEVNLGGQLLSGPKVAGSLLIVGAYGARGKEIVFALDRATGAVKWSFPPAAE